MERLGIYKKSKKNHESSKYFDYIKKGKFIIKGYFLVTLVKLHICKKIELI